MSFNKTKTDPELGLKIQTHLKEKGVQTPMSNDPSIDKLTRTEKIETIRGNVYQIMRVLGLDMEDDSLQDTPNRVAKMFVNEIFWGMDAEAFPKCTAVENKMNYDAMVVERNINVQSNCEHHFVVIDGFATVAYIPKKTVIGLSKINRVVEYFAKRPQIQERLTEQVYHALQFILETDDVAVVIDAQHYCVKSRGVEDAGSSTITSKLGGVFKSDPATRQEFMSIFHNNKC